MTNENSRRFQHPHSLTSLVILALLFVSLITPLSAAMTHYEHQRGVEIAKDHQILFDGDFEFLDFMYSPFYVFSNWV